MKTSISAYILSGLLTAPKTLARIMRGPSGLDATVFTIIFVVVATIKALP